QIPRPPEAEFLVRPKHCSSSRLAILTTSRADAVKDGRRSISPHPSCRQANLDGGEHGVMLEPQVDKTIAHKQSI
ncbi:MAG: hypothetical protein ABW175_04675, partial [Bradyrhizobium sp.]